MLPNKPPPDHSTRTGFGAASPHDRDAASESVSD